MEWKKLCLALHGQIPWPLWCIFFVLFFIFSNSFIFKSNLFYKNKSHPVFLVTDFFGITAASL